ncbi:hemolysin III family protein [Bacillus cereus]
MNAYVREPVNAFTHLGGAILSFIALLAMLVKVSIKMPSFAAITAVILFGIGMMVLYTASAVYHSVVANERVIYFFRKLDRFYDFYINCRYICTLLLNYIKFSKWFTIILFSLCNCDLWHCI